MSHGEIFRGILFKDARVFVHFSSRELYQQLFADETIADSSI